MTHEEERGARIKRALDDAGWTQQELADRVGVRATAISNICLGKTLPSAPTLRRICEALDISPVWILGGVGARRLAPNTPPGLFLVASRSGESGHPGVNKWLRGTPEGQHTTPDERAWLRGCPWPDAHARAPDEAYVLALRAYRLASHV